METTPPPGWTREADALVRTVARADFVEALAFIVAVAKPAQAADHHPDIDLRYNKVFLKLTTHSAGHTVTDKDFALAAQINGIGDAEELPIRQALREQFGL